MPEYTFKQHPLGFKQVSPTPSQEDLEEYYRNKYYQLCTTVTYSTEYTQDELDFFKNGSAVAERVWARHTGKASGSFYDIGCGEGFFLGHFLKKGWKVEGCDFSSFGIERHNPDTCPYFIRGDIYRLLDEKMKTGQRFDLVNLSNVLEHVRDPLELLDCLKAILGDGGLLRICVPNDFSEFQNLLLERGDLKSNTWFAPPDHLNYFTFKSLRAVLEDRGFKIVEMLADFPIEIYLLNEHSNYWLDRSKGRKAHFARIAAENLLFKQGADNYIDYMAAARCGFGRSAIAFAALA
jgi:SAM-dependent methyltransferase